MIRTERSAHILEETNRVEGGFWGGGAGEGGEGGRVRKKK